MAEALNLQRLAQELKDAGSPWEMDPRTEMAMLTEDERRVRLGFTPPPGELSLEEAIRASATPRAVTAAELARESIRAPAEYDLRNVDGKNFTTTVKNQGGCGSCVAFGSVAVLETTAKLSRRDPNFNIDLSEAQMFYCHGGEEGRNCGNGWWPENAFKKAKEKGVTFDSFFPYTAGDQACKPQTGWQESLATSLGHSKLGTRAQIKEWISTRGSVTGCFIVYQDFFSYRSGVYRHVSGDAAGGHCVEILGYSDSQGCWICKNSWGSNWGEGGYFRIAYGEGQIDSWAGPYGVEGVSLVMWTRNARITGLWTDRSDRNAWVHLAGTGWRKVAMTTPTVQHTMLAQAIGAKAGNRRVDVLQDNLQLRQMYVI